MKKTRFAKLKLNSRILLAPMHNINDRAFRELCKKAGAGIVYTELTNPESKKSMDFKDKPAIQLVCNNSRGIKSFIKKHEKNAVLFDFNLGCPSEHAKQTKAGYFMTENYSAIEDILKTIRESTKKPVTVKIRKMPWPVAEKILAIAEKYCDSISIHPRTCSQGYAGVADLEYARKIKASTSLPVIYSGNIETKTQAESLLKEFDYVMMGRKAIGNPNIFYELLGKKPEKRISFFDYLKLAKKYKFDFHHIQAQAMNFTKGIEGASNKRLRLAAAKSIPEVEKIMRG